MVFPFEKSINMYPYPPVKAWSQRTIHNDYFPWMNSSLTSLVPQPTHLNQRADSVDKQKIHESFWNGNIYFEESDCEEMPDLNLAGSSAVQPYMFELTKGTEGEKSASGLKMPKVYQKRWIEEQTIQWPSEKNTHADLQNITHKTKERATWSPPQSASHVAPISLFPLSYFFWHIHPNDIEI